MTKIELALQKKYKDKLLKLALYKKKLTKMKGLLKEYRILCNPKDDVSYFQCEVLYESVCNKKRLEDCFLESYVEMQDFWEDLDYKERNHLIHVDIDRKCKDLKYMIWKNHKFYIPIFDEHLNHIYADEIVNLELKQYRLLTQEFKDQIHLGTYGSRPYQYHFSSAQWVGDSANGYCLYFSKLNRFYYIENERCKKILSLDPQRKDKLDDEKRNTLAHIFMEDDEKAIVERIIKWNLVDDRMKKKIQKIMQKTNV